MAEANKQISEQNQIFRQQLMTQENLFNQAAMIASHQKAIELDLLKIKSFSHLMMTRIMFTFRGLAALQEKLQARKFLKNNFMKLDLDSIKQAESQSLTRISEISDEIQQLESSMLS